MPAAVVTGQHEHTDKHPPHKRASTVHYPFWFGGSASCFAAAVTHPLDLARKTRGRTPLTLAQVRLQTTAVDGPRSMTGMFVLIFKEGGIPGLFRGLSAAQLRAVTYSTTRFGVYEVLKQQMTPEGLDPKAHQLSVPTLIAMSGTSGFLGGLVGNPADVINVRMQHDAALPIEKRRNYRNAIVGLTRIAREEGFTALFRGVLPNSTRASLMTASQLASYDSIKDVLMHQGGMKDNLTTHFTASTIAGFIATTICSPVDVIKTRVMSAQTKESIGVLIPRIMKEEGIRWMFRGWLPSFIRLGPNTVATFVALEQHKKIYRHLKGIET